MKQLSLMIFVMSLLSLSVSGLAQTRHSTEYRPNSKISKTKNIELIKGIPKKPYIEIAPIWTWASNRKEALKKIRNEALKVGADAIIEFKIETKQLSSDGVIDLGKEGEGKPVPVVQGVAVKWVNFSTQ